MTQNENDAPATVDIFRSLWSHKQAMIWTFWCIMLVTIAVTFLGSKKYTSEAKLFVRLGRESTALDPTAAASANQFVTIQASREYEINSVLEIFNSRDVLASVVSGLGPQAVLEEQPEASVQSAGFLPIGDLFAPYSIEDDALEHLSKHLDVQPVKDSNVISISYEATSPELARDVVTKLVARARDSHIRVNRTDGSQEFFVAQAEQLRERLTRLESELRDRKNAAKIADLDEQRALLLREVSTMRAGLLDTEASLAAATAEMKSHERLIETVPESITLGHTTGMPQSAVASMREQLFAAQVHEKGLLSKFTKEHPLAVAAAQQIAALESVLANEPIEPQVSRGPNHAHQELNLAYLKGEPLVSKLQAQGKVLREELSPVEDELKTLNNAEAEFARLEREIAIESENYKRYAECLEQSRIDHELAMKNISNLNVLQPPSYSVTPSSPRPLLNLGLGFFVAVMASFGVGLTLEHRRTGFLYRLSQPAPYYALPGFASRGDNGHLGGSTAQRRWDSPPGLSAGDGAGDPGQQNSLDMRDDSDGHFPEQTN